MQAKLASHRQFGPITDALEAAGDKFQISRRRENLSFGSGGLADAPFSTIVIGRDVADWLQP